MKSLDESLQSTLSRIKARTQEEIDMDKEQRNRVEIQSLRDKWNAPRRHSLVTANTKGPWGDALRKAAKCLEGGESATVAIVGNRGNGKTQIGVELMKQFTAQKKSALFCTAIEFFMEIKATFKKDSNETESEVLAWFRKPKLLVIDEVGKRSGSEWESQLLFELINSRYNDLKATVLIDNRSAKEFSETIGPSLCRRINEGGGIIECNW